MTPPMIPNPHVGQALCAHCHQWRLPEQLVQVERLATGQRRFVCRLRRCFRIGIGPADVDRIVPSERVAP